MPAPHPETSAPARPRATATWPGLLLRGVLLAVTAELVAAAVARAVLAADPGVLAPEPLTRALVRGAAIAAAVAGALLLLDALLAPLLAALRRGRPAPEDAGAARPELAWLLVLAVGAPWALSRWTFGVVHRGDAIDLPLLARSVSVFFPWLVAALAAEALLLGVRLTHGRSAPWWLLRGALGVAWALLLLALVSGPDILRGDPLEWATRLRDTALSQEWLNRAPLAPARGWPALQLGAMVALLLTLLAAGREFWRAWQAWRGRTSRAAGAR